MRIKEQQNTILNIDENLRKKTQQIIKLRSLVDKFQPFYHKYNQLSAEFVQKSTRLSQKQQEVNLLLNQIQQILKQNESIQLKYQININQKAKLLKQQQQIQKVNHEIEETFHLYRQECKKKQMGLLKDLQKAYKQITQLNKRIDQYEMKVFENDQLKKRLYNKQKIEEGQAKNNDMFKTQQNNQNINQNNILKRKIDQLKLALASKEEQLIKQKIINRQLSLQFDHSVSKICEFETELAKYRRQNHQLKKIISLYKEKQDYEQLHKKQLYKYQKQSQQESIEIEFGKGKRSSQQKQNERVEHLGNFSGIRERKGRESV